LIPSNHAAEGEVEMDGSGFDRQRTRPGGPRPAVVAGTLAAVDADAANTAAAPETLEQFLAAVSARAFRFAELGLRHREDALDAVQDAMAKMLGYRDRPPPEWTPLFWTVLRSRIVDLQRRRTFRLGWIADAREPDGGEIDWADEGMPDPSRAHDGREAYAMLADALRELPARQREAFTLRVLEELDVETTARVMGCSEGSVKTHLFRARDALQKRLEDFR
jgi:RNA polymerase sigma-70 factor, ECF subfamily